jgi:alpha-beta hydrolase superfamily lysophospholipase
MNILLPILLVVLLFYVFFRFVPTENLIPHPDPATSFETAEKRLQTWAEAEAELPLQEVCKTKFLSHGYQTEQVILFLHGYTTCPEQFAELGQMFFEKGYNVLIPCLSHHGWKDRLTDELKYLTAEELAEYGNRSMDIARGLGKKVIVLGISGGGTVVSWLAQNRDDLDVAVPLAAFLRMYVLPAFLTIPFINLFSLLPNFFIWWDPRTKEKNPYSIYYAYPRYSFRTLAEVMRLGLAVKRQAKRREPAAGKILVMENDFDMGVSNAEIERLTELWKAHKPEKVNSYHFEREMKMLHDIITPGTPGIPTAEIYTRILHEVEAMDTNNPIESEK